MTRPPHEPIDEDHNVGERGRAGEAALRQLADLGLEPGRFGSILNRSLALVRSCTGSSQATITLRSPLDGHSWTRSLGADSGGPSDTRLRFPLRIGDSPAGELTLMLPGPTDETRRFAAELVDELCRVLAHRLWVDRLRHSEERFEQITSSVDDLLWLRPARGERFLYLSPAFETIWGRPGADALARPELWMEGIHPDDRAAAGLHGTDRHRPRTLEYRIVRPDGSMRYIRERRFPIFGRRSRPRIVAGVARDVTAEQQADHHRRRLAVAVECAAEAIVMTDRLARVIYMNPAAEASTGWSLEELAGESISRLGTGTMPPEHFAAMWHKIEAGEVWRGDFVNRRKDGSSYFEEATISPLRGTDGSIDGFVAVKRDVTEERRLREELVEARELELLGRIVRGLVHEVRNPLHSLMSLLDALSLDLADRAEATELIEIALGQVQRLSRLMNDLLQLGRPKQPTRFERIDLSILAEEYCATARRTTGGPAIRLEGTGVPHFVEVDPFQIQTVFQQLIQNALQAGGPDGEIEVTLEEDSSQVLLRVADRCPGIPETHLADIFQPFFTTHRDGTGLGLAIVNHILRRHRGSVRVSNRDPGPGCCFEVALPRAEGDPS